LQLKRSLFIMESKSQDSQMDLLLPLCSLAQLHVRLTQVSDSARIERQL